MFKQTILITILLLFFSSCTEKKETVDDKIKPKVMPFVVNDGFFYKNGEKQEKMFIAGVNLGVGVPGTMAGELAATKEDYLRWFAQMKDIGFNSLRTYTIHFPRFYEALDEFNKADPDDPIYLFHGIWLDEEDIENGDLFTISDHFDSGIKEAVDVVHGNADIGHRYGRAYGSYETDISNWIAGWIIGREVSPFEVASTNFHNDKVNSFSGEFFKISNCDPAEAWFTERLDILAGYEFEKYGVKRPLSMSSWPTLDPLKHRTEGSLSFEDTNTIDLVNIDDSKFEPGYFASYHAYPYYPNFMNSEPSYLSYTDSYGINNYTGYLTELKSYYGKKPLLIAEFGVPSSIGNAHFSVSGMHHGGHDEETQGEYIKRMFETIRDTNCAGGMYFAWIDEWWKRTWITDELDFPYDRRALWHNITAAEQNFGLIAFETDLPEFKTVATGGTLINKVEAAHDLKYFYLKLSANEKLKDFVKFQIGFDTYKDDAGESVLPDGTKTDVRSEFALEIDTFSSTLYVTEAYNTYGIWHYISGDEQLYRSIPTDGAPWKMVKWINSGEHGSDDNSYLFPNVDHEIGKFRTFEGKIENASSHDLVIFDGKTLTVRIPWTLLHFTDPSTLSVMDDDRETPDREVATTEGIRAVIAINDDVLTTERYLWEPWEVVPEYHEREKTSYFIVKEFFDSFSKQPVKFENILKDQVLANFKWGELTAGFSTEEGDCDIQTVTVSEVSDGAAGFHFAPVKLEKGWYEYSDISSFDGKSEFILRCGDDSFFSIAQTDRSPDMERSSVRFYAENDCEYTVLRTVSEAGKFRICSPALRKIEPVKFDRPYFSMVFDDIWSSAATVGAGELTLRKQYGTFFVTRDFTTSGNLDYADEEMIIELYNSGHEIGFHSFSHDFLSTLTTDEIDADFERGIEWFDELGIEVDGIAFPYGDHDERVVSMARKYFKYARNSFHGLNDGTMNRFGIKIFPVTNLTTLDEMKAFAQTAIENNLWAVFLFHDLGEPDTENEYRTPMKDFTELLDFLDESKAYVEPVNAVLGQVGKS